MKTSELIRSSFGIARNVGACRIVNAGSNPSSSVTGGRMKPQPYAVYVDETDMVWVSDWGANAIPALHDALEARGPLALVVALEPFGLDQLPPRGAGWHYSAWSPPSYRRSS
jgi:hypothetical protein